MNVQGAAEAMDGRDQPCEGAPVGTYFFWRPGAKYACRWDALVARPGGQGTGSWVRWPLPTPAPPKVPLLCRGLIRLGLIAATPPTAEKAEPPKGKPGSTSEDKESETAAKAAADSAQKAVDRHREAVKWFVVTAGTVAAAVIGTAPLAGLAPAVARDPLGLATWGFLITVAALVFILLFVAWTIQPLEKSTAELASAKPGLFNWRKNLQRSYEEDSDLFLDGRAATLQMFKLYRQAWRGIEADIDRQLEREEDPARYARLQEYLAAARERIKRDDDMVAANLGRGAVAEAAARGSLAILVSVLASVIAAAGLLLYLGGTVMEIPPVITDLAADPKEPGLGASATLTALATGEGLDYVWVHDGIQIEDGADYSGSATRTLTIHDFQDPDAGTYRVTVIDAEDESVFDEIELAEPPEPAEASAPTKPS